MPAKIIKKLKHTYLFLNCQLLTTEYHPLHTVAYNEDDDEPEWYCIDEEKI